MGSNPATPTRNRRSVASRRDLLINFPDHTARQYSSGHPAPPLEGLPGRCRGCWHARLAGRDRPERGAGSASPSGYGRRAPAAVTGSRGSLRHVACPNLAAAHHDTTKSLTVLRNGSLTVAALTIGTRVAVVRGIPVHPGAHLAPREVVVALSGAGWQLVGDLTFGHIFQFCRLPAAAGLHQVLR